MKVNIITFHAAHNYGAVLQAYGLQEVLRELGHDPQFIDYQSLGAVNKKKRIRKIKSIRDIAVCFVERLLAAHFKKRYNRFEAFIEQNLSLTPVRYSSPKELHENPPFADAYICGSDQVWNVENGIARQFFLNFVPSGRKKISYAPSFGTEKIPEKYYREIKDLLKTFHALSIREKSGEIILKEIGFSAQQVIDPAFLLPAEKWDAVALNPNLNFEYIVFYSLEVGSELSNLVAQISKTLKMPVVILGKGGSFVVSCRTILKIDSGPAEFLGFIKNAKMVITNSFHAAAFSIIFNTPFIVYPHSGRNTRMECLLNRFEMSERMYSKDYISIVSPAMFELPMEVFREEKLIDMRRDSIQFLRDSLSF